MKKYVVAIVFIVSISSVAQNVNIPDANFKAKLIQLGVDTNSDGDIQVSEAQVVTDLTIPVSNILDLTGIQSFTNLNYLNCSYQSNGFGPGLSSLNLNGLSSLTYLDCSNNSIANLDVSFLTNLSILKCNYNSLSSLVVSSLINLTELEFAHNQISTINLGANSNLTHLLCYSNQLSDLDVNSLTNLEVLFCGENPLDTLNVSNVNNLLSLGCNQNGLTNIDITNLINLRFLDCDDNQISSLDLQNQIYLTDLRCNGNLLSAIDLSNAASDGSNFGLQFGNNPNLTYVNIKNAGNFIGFYPTNCPNLAFICINDEDISYVSQELLNYGISGVNFNSYCSYTPGGNYNTITGAIIFDVNSNGCDASDLPYPNIKININDGINQGNAFTNNTGNYSFYTQAGSFDITPNIENPSWFTFSPATATIPFTNNNNNGTTQNFCITANGVHPNVEIVIAPILLARPGFDAVYQIVYKNIGNQVTSGIIDFSYDDTVLDFVSATVAPNGSSTGILNWNYTNLLPFENRTIYVTLNVNSPQETPPVNIGDQLYFTTSITSSAGDEMVEDNFFGYQQTVVGSLDPNDITCIEGDVVPPSEIGEYLHYVINFENTGTAAAENVVVRTDIDAAQFDVNSLQMLNTSHNAYIRQTGNTIEFIFEGIYLDTGGHGNVLLKIKSLNNLQEGDMVAKQANIFFDYNFPIETNMANTTFQALNTPGFEIDESISVYPNPTNSIVTITSNNSMQSVQLYDVQGRLLQTQIINNPSTTVDLSQQSNGIYFVKVVSDQGIKVEKVVKK